MSSPPLYRSATEPLVYDSRVPEAPIFPQPNHQSNDENGKGIVVLTSGNRETGGGVHQRYERERKTWSEWMKKDFGGGYRVVVVGEVMAFIGGYKEKTLKSDVEIYHMEKKLWINGRTMNNARYDQTFFNIT